MSDNSIRARRSLLAAAAAAPLAAALPAAAQAAFPSRPIRVVIGFPAGGPLDQHARGWADRVEKILGQPVLVDY